MCIHLAADEGMYYGLPRATTISMYKNQLFLVRNMSYGTHLFPLKYVTKLSPTNNLPFKIKIFRN